MVEFPETRESLLLQVKDPQNREAWEQYQYKPKGYTAGTWGPGAASALISKDGLRWNED